MEDLWKIYERFMEGLWRIYDGCMEDLLMRLAADSLLSRWQLYFAFCMNLYELDFLRVFRFSSFSQGSSFASRSRAWATDMSFMSQSAFLCIGGFMEDLCRIYGRFMMDSWKVYGGFMKVLWTSFPNFDV